MSSKEHGSRATSGQASPSSRAQDGREPALDSRRTFRLQNSTVTLEPGLRGPLARVVRLDGVDYAGPLPPETIEALAEVADRG